jgi:hypothetical protein
MTNLNNLTRDVREMRKDMRDIGTRIDGWSDPLLYLIIGGLVALLAKDRVLDYIERVVEKSPTKAQNDANKG